MCSDHQNLGKDGESKHCHVQSRGENPKALLEQREADEWRLNRATSAPTQPIIDSTGAFLHQSPTCTPVRYDCSSRSFRNQNEEPIAGCCCSCFEYKIPFLQVGHICQLTCQSSSYMHSSQRAALMRMMNQIMTATRRKKAKINFIQATLAGPYEC